jgi:hypothetical protein
MDIKRTCYWHGQPLSELSREGLERAAASAIGELMTQSEHERKRQAFDLASLAFMGGVLLAGLGALAGILLAH